MLQKITSEFTQNGLNSRQNGLVIDSVTKK